MTSVPTELSGAPALETAPRSMTDALAPVSVPNLEATGLVAPDRIREQIVAEQVKTLYGQSVPVLLANVVNAVLTTGVLWSQGSRPFLALWALAMIVMTAARVELRRRYLAAANRSAESSSWGRRFSIGSCAAGLLWGCVGGAMLPESLPHQLFVLFVLGGMASGAASTLSCHMPAFYLYLLPSLLPVELRLIAFGGRIDLAMAAMTALFMAALTMVARNVNRSMTDAFSLRFENGLLLGRVSSAQDSLKKANRRLISAKDKLERVVAERTSALRQSEQRLAEIVRESPDGIMILGRDTSVLSVNPAMARITGLSEIELLGRPLSGLGFVRADHITRVHGALTRVLGGKEWPPFEVELRHSSGRPVALELNLRLVAQTAEGDRRVHAVVRDVSSRRQTERAREELETRLRQAQRLESVGLLAGGVAHDFNNVLTVISGNLDALCSASGDVERRGLAAEIRHATRQAARLTTQLLAFSRQQVLDVRVVDLNTVIEDMDAMLRGALSERNTLRMVPSRQPATVRADPTQLEQALLNLVVNARDAMPGGGRVDVEVSRTSLNADDALERDMPPGDYVLLAVSDTGIGMDESTQGRAFEPFFTTKEPGHGTGLGLSTVHGIVKQCGGHISVQSRPGHGTRFEMLFPFDSADPVPRTASLLPPLRTPAHETILLVEDQPHVRRAADRILRAAGYRVLLANDGEQALDLASQYRHQIDLLVSDVVMPGLNGIELGRRLLADDPGLSVLLVSGYTRDPLRTEEIGRGVQFLQKPFDAEGLVRAVSNALTSAHREERRSGA